MAKTGVLDARFRGHDNRAGVRSNKPTREERDAEANRIHHRRDHDWHPRSSTRLRPARAELPDHAQDQRRRVGRAAQRGAHLALRGEGARLLRQALHRRQHRAVRGRPVADLGGRRRAGHRDRQRQRRLDRPRPQGAADLGPRAAHAAGLHGAGGHHQGGRAQGQAAVRDRRRRRRLQLAHGPRGAEVRRARPRATRSSSPRPPPGACPA